jgi:hypothetical protein
MEEAVTPLPICSFEQLRQESWKLFKSILTHRLSCVSEPSSSLTPLISAPIIPTLIIPIILSFNESAKRIIADLRDKFSNTPFLTVVDLANLNTINGNLSLQNQDFITITLNDFELPAREKYGKRFSLHLYPIQQNRPHLLAVLG